MVQDAIARIRPILQNTLIHIVSSCLVELKKTVCYTYLSILVEEILEKGMNNNKYDIPDELALSREIVLEQLQLIKTLNLNEPAPKIQKVDNIKSLPDDGVTKQSPLYIKKSETIKLATASAGREAEPKAGPSQDIQRKQDIKENLQDFFKDRANTFKKKDPSDMRAPSPPLSESTQSRAFENEQKLEAAMKKLLPVIVPRGKMAEKLKKANPYNVFLTTITAAKETHNEPLSVTFQEILDPSLGELESSVQINFMVEITWLLAQYTFARCANLPLLILYGQECDTLRDINKKRPNVTSIRIEIPTPIGCHHSKIMLLFYRDQSMRIVISTANLYEDDWHNRVQGLWISDRLPPLADGESHMTHGESVTNFREDFIRYMSSYNLPKLSPIIARIKQTDFKDVNVFFVSSIPGSHRDTGKGIIFGHPKIGSLLAQYSAPIDDSCPIILQSSSLGTLGPNAKSYLTSEITTTFKKDSAPAGLRRVPSVKLIYPSLNNVMNSHDGVMGGGCLPYSKSANEKQPWLHEYLYQWKATSRNRNKAMPHIKSYCRYSDRGLYWFILTSANFSKSALGAYNKNSNMGPTLRINSYEAGVVFFPRIILNNKNFFPMNESQQKNGEPIFKLPYDIPPIPYAHNDIPFCSEYLMEYMRRHGLAQ